MSHFQKRPNRPDTVHVCAIIIIRDTCFTWFTFETIRNAVKMEVLSFSGYLGYVFYIKVLH